MKSRMGTLFLLFSAILLFGCGATALTAAPTATQAVIAYTPTLTSTPTLIPTATSAPVLGTPTQTLTPTPAVPSFTLTENAFCRKGPDVSFSDVTGITKGETVAIQGVSEDGYWYFVFWARFKVKCWVAKPTGQAGGDLTGVPVMVSPDTPTPV
jgi:hypothetical protein